MIITLQLSSYCLASSLVWCGAIKGQYRPRWTSKFLNHCRGWSHTKRTYELCHGKIQASQFYQPSMCCDVGINQELHFQVPGRVLSACAAHQGLVKNSSSLSKLLRLLNEFPRWLDVGMHAEALAWPQQSGWLNDSYSSLNKVRIVLYPKESLSMNIFYVRIGGKLSTKLDFTSGIPERSVLGPLLFLCSVNDLALCLKLPS